MIGDCACFQVKGAGVVVHIWGLVGSDLEKEAVRLAAETALGGSAVENDVGVFSSPRKGAAGRRKPVPPAKFAAGQQAVPPYSLRQRG